MNSKQHQKGTQQLKKNLGLSTAMATVVGCVIGSGVFLKPQASTPPQAAHQASACSPGSSPGSSASPPQ